MQRIRQLVSTLAPSGVDILLNGETRVGKEVGAGDPRRQRSARAVCRHQLRRTAGQRV